MTQAPDWTLKEFETLINLPGVPAGELSRLLGTRPADAIESAVEITRSALTA